MPNTLLLLALLSPDFRLSVSEFHTQILYSAGHAPKIMNPVPVLEILADNVSGVFGNDRRPGPAAWPLWRTTLP
jgi:hypothetical protein